MKNSFAKHWASLQLGCPQLSSAPVHWVALSGGADSIALVHLLHKLPQAVRPNLSVVHVNHGLSNDAGKWSEFCALAAQQLNLPFHAIHLRDNPNERKRLGIEGWARTARYAAIADLIADGDVVHCAQHQSDQAETLFLSLMRGSGPDGLASMPVVRSLGRGWLCRPLLDFTRAELQEVALAEQGAWIEDPSNQDLSFDRNFLRAEVIPALSDRWPAATRSMARSASLAGESSEALAWFAAKELVTLSENRHCRISANASRSAPSWISIEPLSKFPLQVRQQLLRQWVLESGVDTLPFSKMVEIGDSVLTAREDKNPFIRWSTNAYLGRFKKKLWLFNDQAPCWPAALKVGDIIECGSGTVRLVPSDQGFDVPEGGLRISCRQGSERFRKEMGGQSTLLKKYLNEQAVLPWWRDQLPLFWHTDELVAIGGLWQQRGLGSWELSWKPAPCLTAKR